MGHNPVGVLPAVAPDHCWSGAALLSAVPRSQTVRQCPSTYRTSMGRPRTGRPLSTRESGLPRARSSRIGACPVRKYRAVGRSGAPPRDSSGGGRTFLRRSRSLAGPISWNEESPLRGPQEISEVAPPTSDGLSQRAARDSAWLRIPGSLSSPHGGAVRGADELDRDDRPADAICTTPRSETADTGRTPLPSAVFGPFERRSHSGFRCNPSRTYPRPSAAVVPAIAAVRGPTRR